MSVPSPRVLTAFGLQGSPQRLPGGEGRTFRVGDYVLKPVDELVPAEWIADVLSNHDSQSVRIPKPRRAINGEWIVQWFTCWSFLKGHHEPRRWNEIIATGDDFHQEIAHLTKPEWFDHAEDIFHRADRFAWDEAILEFEKDINDTVSQLIEIRQPLPNLPSQIIHGDLTGNVLFSEGEKPAIIDFSPYWRPIDYAAAIVAIDAAQWEDAGDDILDLVAERIAGRQLLVRAALFRAAITGQRPEASKEEVDREMQFAEHLRGYLGSP